MTYINPREKVFAHLGRIAAWREGQRPAPVSIEWDLSNRCPWGCHACHFAHTHTRGPWTRDVRALPMAHDPGGDLADTALVQRALNQVSDIGVKAVVWTGGGEPTVHPDFRYLVRHAHARGLAQGLYTLGATLDEESVWLRDVLTWVVVSLDALDAGTYAREKRSPGNGFARACAAVMRLSGGHTCAVGVSFLLDARNWTQARDMVGLARQLGATYATLRPTITTSPAAPGMPLGDRAWVTDALPLLDDLSHEPDVEVDPSRFAAWRDWTGHGYGTCYGVQLSTTITPDGRVWWCPNRRAFAGSCIGDLRRESFATLWARHAGQVPVDQDCRAMCRLHPVNQTLAAMEAPRAHAVFI